MFYNNYGNLEIKNEYANDLQDMLKTEISGVIDVVEDFKPGIAYIEISECEGDISDDLEKILKHFTSKGIMINGLINYSGDYDGVYVIKDGELECYDEKEWILKNVIKDGELECYDEKEWILKNAFNENAIAKSLKKKLLDEIGNITSLIQLERLVNIINAADEF